MKAPKQKRSRLIVSSIVLMIYSSMAFALMVACVKFASQTLPSFEVVFFRSLLGTCVALPLMIRKKVSFTGRHKKILWLRGVSGFCALSLFFYALAHLPLATAVILNYIAPIFSAILAMIFLKEKCTPFLFAMILVAFLGIYLLVDGSFTALNLYTVAGIVSALFAAISYVSIRAIKHRESPLTIMFYFTGISTIGSLFYLPLGFQWPNWSTWIALLGVGVGSFFGQLWMTIALRRAPTSKVSPFSYAMPLFSFVLGLLFWKESLEARTLVGASLIIVGGVLISYFETKPESIPAAQDAG